MLALARGLTLLFSLALAGIGQFWLRDNQLTNGVLAFAVAMILFAGSIFGIRPEEPVARRPARIAGGSQRRTVVGALLLLFSFICAVVALGLFREASIEVISWRWHLLSLLFFPLGLATITMSDPRERLHRLAMKLRGCRWDLLLLLAAVVGGGLLRFTGLAELPYGLWFDEAENGIWAREVLTRDDFRPLYVPATNRTLHILYLFALSFEWFGVNVASLRGVSAAFGTATIIGIWLLGREVGGRWVGILAAGLIAVSHWGLNFSRLGMDGITTPFFASLSAWALLRGLRVGSPLLASLGGLALGLGMCIYAPLWLFPLVIVIFLIGKAITQRGVENTQVAVVAAFICGALLAFAPVGQYAQQDQDEFFRRTRQASLFVDKAPEERQEALQWSLRRHLLMFNHQGDQNGRHNLPGEPQLDPFAGALFPLGTAVALSRMHRPRQLLLVSWLCIMLVPGILSLSFEAPQSLRAIGTMPVTYLLAAQAVLLSRKCLQNALTRVQIPKMSGKKVSRWLLAMAALATVGLSASHNIDVYFERQANDPRVYHAFNVREALTAHWLKEYGETHWVYSIYTGHPTIRFLIPEAPTHRPFQPIDDLPIRGLVDRDVRYIMEPEFAPPPEQFQSWYPGGVLEWHDDVAGVPMLYTFTVSRQEVNAIQGVRQRLYEADAEAGMPPLVEERVDTLWIDWGYHDLATPLRGEWDGQLFVPYSGVYEFHLRSAGDTQLEIGGDLLTLDGKEQAAIFLELTRGWHALRWMALSSDGRAGIQWVLPDGLRGNVPRENLTVRPSPRNGLWGAYFVGMDWADLATFSQVDPLVDFRWHIQPLLPPFSVQWTGGLVIDVPGIYTLAISANSDASLDIGGVRIIHAMDPPYGYHEGTVYLQKGIVPLRVRYREAGGYSEMRLQWRRPDGTIEPIPTRHLVPMIDSVHEGKRDVGAPPHDVEAEVPPWPGLTLKRIWGSAGSGQGEFLYPRGVAIDSTGRIYVADTGNQRVQVFDTEGGLLRILTQGAQPLVEPSDLAIDSRDWLHVLDSSRQRIVSYAEDGKYEAELGDGLDFYNPRGLDVDHEGNLYVADTGGLRIVKLSPSGEVRRVIRATGVRGLLDQPVDVAVARDGRFYVTEPAASRMRVLDAAGRYLGEWPLSGSCTVDGPHVAIMQQGWLLVTDPEVHQVLVFNPVGEQLGVWGEKGDAPGAFNTPVGIAASSDGTVIVSDTFNHRVQLFALREAE